MNENSGAQPVWLREMPTELLLIFWMRNGVAFPTTRSIARAEQLVGTKNGIALSRQPLRCRLKRETSIGWEGRTETKFASNRTMVTGCATRVGQVNGVAEGRSARDVDLKLSPLGSLKKQYKNFRIAGSLTLMYQFPKSGDP
jgi:hypothetical protein